MEILGVVLFGILVGVLIWAAIYVFRQDLKIKAVSTENNQLRAHVIAVDAENQRLAPYAVVPDANVEAARIIAEASKSAEAKATEMKSYEDQVLQWAQGLIQNAQTDEALSLKKKESYESIATALHNTIEGYGNQYLIPAPSLLDDLARDFGFLEAGQKLKQARALTRSMVKENKAVTSGYSDKERREAASSFVLDAFNGKVDTALATVKGENAGILAQKIQDAFTLINNYGRTFGDTRITQAYLKARLDELKWAATAQQLRLDEREEQRRIKEQMREDEKARREIEKAQKESAREQEILQKALETARHEATQVGEEQRAEYEQRLQEMEAKLREAEEKGQRALSMAQQTKKGHVYVISNIGSFGEGVFKIGQTRRLDPEDRVYELGGSSVPFEFDIHAMIKTDDAPGLEYQLHKHFVLSQLNKVNPRKEFFRFDLNAFKEDIERMGLDVKWTMTAQANQYRQTLTIEESLQNDAAFRDEWMKRQIRLKFEQPNAGSILSEDKDGAVEEEDVNTDS